MKIAYDKLTTVIKIEENSVNSIVIEDAKFMYQTLKDIKLAMEGIDSGIVVSINEKPINISKNIDYVTDFVSFTLNQKTLNAKVINELEKIAKDENNYEKSQEILALIENYVIDLAMDFPCEISCEKLNIQSLLKGIAVSIVDDYDSLEESILSYMDLARDLLDIKLFIFANLRCLVPEEKLSLMIDTAITREHKILLIDNMEYAKLSNENRLIIDKDLCEI